MAEFKRRRKMLFPLYIAHAEMAVRLFSSIVLGLLGFTLLIVAAIIEQTENDPREWNERWKIFIAGVFLVGLGIVQFLRFRFG